MSSIPYDLHVTVSGYKPEKFDEITDILGERWPAWKHALPINDMGEIDVCGEGCEQLTKT